MVEKEFEHYRYQNPEVDSGAGQGRYAGVWQEAYQV
jgi:hypothetical protein